MSVNPDEMFGRGVNDLMYRDHQDRRFWHAWAHGVHIWWGAVIDDFGNLVPVNNDAYYR